MYGGRCRPVNPMIARIRATLNPSFGNHFQITWASIAASTSWTQAHLYFGESDRERFRTEPGPTADLQNSLESAVEERWERYLQEGVLETPDLSFSTPSWAGVESMPLLLSKQLEDWQPTEARHLTEADSVLPEQEATRYETPANSKQSIDEELGIQDVTNIREDWYAQSELVSTVKSVLQPMEVDEPPEEPPRISDEEAPDMLGPNLGSSSPVTAAEDRALDTPGGFSRAPGGRKTNHRIRSRFLWPTDYGTLHRGIDAKTLDSEEDRGSEVLQMKIEDQVSKKTKFDFT